MSTHITALASPVASTRSHESDTDCVPAMDDSTIMPSLSLTRQFRESHSPDSPSASIAMLRTAETLDGLARQLTELHDSRLAESDPDIAVRCCCGASVDCPTFAARDRMDAKLKLCGEIGTALLHRYEALEQKYHHAELQLEIKRKALADSLRHVANLERANTTHLAKYADQSRSYEALEKRYTQAMHSQTLTQQSLSHTRAELAKMRRASNSQMIALAAGSSTEDRLLDAERRFEDIRDLQQAESRKLRDELKWRRMAEDRIADLEAKLTTAVREVEDVKNARARDAQELLANAKDRLEVLHSELSETFNADQPSEMPEYQRTLEDLVATNALLQHDTSELARSLATTLEDNRALRDEMDELRSHSTSSHSRPLSMELRPLITSRHARTGSNPVIGSTPELMRGSHARGASVAVPRGGGVWEHRRQSSIAPSFTSTSTTEGMSVTSPSPQQGYTTFSEFGGSPLVRLDSNGNPVSPDLARPSSRNARNSFSGGIPYTYNGVPKTKAGRPRPKRALSDRRSLTMRALGVGEVNSVAEAISEWAAGDDCSTGDQGDRSGERSVSVSTSASEEPASPGEDSFEPIQASPPARRKRASVLLPNGLAGMTSPHSSTVSPLPEAGGFDALPHPQPDGYKKAPQLGRRTLLLLSRSTGVQTEPFPESQPPVAKLAPEPEEPEVLPDTSVFESETSSLHDASQQLSAADLPTIAELVEFLTKVLQRMRGVDLPTLNRRLKKQHLPGDVGHLSRSTISSLQNEVADMRHRFRNILDQSSVNRRDLQLLMKLLKDVFTDLLELQSVVNDVTLNPKLAKKLRREAFEEEGDTPQSSGLGWIAAPITSFFTAPTPVPAVSEPPASPTRPGRAAMTSRLAAPVPVRTAPKLQASTAATTTNISVEFGGSGMVRRATPAAPKKTMLTATSAADVFSTSPAPRAVSDSAVRSTTPLTSSATTAVSASTVSARPQRNVRTQSSRSDLLGIFAGAQGPGSSPVAPGRVRHASSQYFGRPPASRVVTEPRGRLSTIVDAVLDAGAEGTQDDPGDFRPALLERQLRPRGLSDSSIRSSATAVLNEMDAENGGAAQHGHYIPELQPSVTRARVADYVPSAVGSALGSVSGSISRRIWRGPEKSPEQSKAPSAERSKEGGPPNPALEYATPSLTPPTPRPTRSAPRAISPGPSALVAPATVSTGVSPVQGEAVGFLSAPRQAGSSTSPSKARVNAQSPMPIAAVSRVVSGSAMSSSLGRGSWR